MTSSSEESPDLQPDTPIRWRVSEEFPAWLAASGGSVALTTYQAGQVALIGFDLLRNEVTLDLRAFDKPMGLAVKGSKLALATRRALVLLEDVSSSIKTDNEVATLPTQHDTHYVPGSSVDTGDISMHDVAFGAPRPALQGGDAQAIDDKIQNTPEEIWFINTRHSCLCTTNHDGGYVPKWKPKFVSELAPEDRCHLNGLAMRAGKPAHVSALGTTDVGGTWRENKTTGGVILDIRTGEIVLNGLCMPHSPRWFRPEGSKEPEKLYFLNSGQGELCVMTEADVSRGKYTVIAALPGYTRGLAFATSTATRRTYALVGLSHVRSTHVFDGLPVQQRWGGKLQAGVCVVDLTDGRHVAAFEFTEGCTELYDVQFLPAARRPVILNRADPDVTRPAILPTCFV